MTEGRLDLKIKYRTAYEEALIGFLLDEMEGTGLSDYAPADFKSVTVKLEKEVSSEDDVDRVEVMVVGTLKTNQVIRTPIKDIDNFLLMLFVEYMSGVL